MLGKNNPGYFYKKLDFDKPSQKIAFFKSLKANKAFNAPAFIFILNANIIS